MSDGYPARLDIRPTSAWVVLLSGLYSWEWSCTLQESISVPAGGLARDSAKASAGIILSILSTNIHDIFTCQRKLLFVELFFSLVNIDYILYVFTYGMPKLIQFQFLVKSYTRPDTIKLSCHIFAVCDIPLKSRSHSLNTEYDKAIEQLKRIKDYR